MVPANQCTTTSMRFRKPIGDTTRLGDHMGQKKLTKILLVLGMQKSLCNKPQNLEVKAQIIKKIKRYLLDGSHNRRERAVLLLNNPSLELSDLPDDLFSLYGDDPYRRSLAAKQIKSSVIDSRTVDPFVDTKLDDILKYLTAKWPWKIELCGFGYDRIWFAAAACALRGYTTHILTNDCGSHWVYEFQEEDRNINSKIILEDE